MAAVMRARAMLDGRRHKVLVALAAHPDGLISRQLAEQYGEDTGQRMLTRYGSALRALRDAGCVRAAGTVPSGRQNTPANVYQITDAGRELLGAIDAPRLEPWKRSEPPKPQRVEYPWVADAGRRHLAGEAVSAIAAEYHVCPQTVQRALKRRGVQIKQRVERPRKHPQPKWAAEAAQRYRDGETRVALCAAYKAGDGQMVRVLKAEGVTLRNAREVRRLIASARRQGQEADDAAPGRRNRIVPAAPEAM